MKEVGESKEKKEGHFKLLITAGRSKEAGSIYKKLYLNVIF